MTNALPRVAAYLQSGEYLRPLRITAFGSSTTEGYGATDPVRTSYPAVTRERLLPFVPGGIALANRGVSGEDIEAMASRFAAIPRDRPDLVLVQTGSNDGPHGIGVGRFEHLMEELIGVVRSCGADPLLIEPQFCTVLEAEPRFPPFLDSVRAIGARHAIPVFPRYDEMRLWAAETGLGCAGLSPDGMHMDDLGYGLLGEAIAAFIRQAAGAGDGWARSAEQGLTQGTGGRARAPSSETDGLDGSA